jgi:hypothetical protein
VDTVAKVQRPFFGRPSWDQLVSVRNTTFM